MGAHVVDVHSHVYPQSYLESMRAARHDVPVPESFSDLAAKLAFMDEHGIDRALVSLGNPWLDPLGAAGEEVAARLNSELAGLAAQTDGRLLGFGVLPQASVDSAVATAESVAAEPGLFGLITGSRICGRRLDDDRLDPLWDLLAAHGLPLFVHPHHGPGGTGAGAPGSVRALALGFPLETTLALGDLVLAGIPQRFPGLRVVGAHCGGALPVLAGRLQAFWEARAQGEAQLPGPPSESAARLAFDAVGYAPAAVRAALDLAGPARVFFGTDHPFPVAMSDANRAALEAALSKDERTDVYGRAAVEFFGLPPG